MDEVLPGLWVGGVRAAMDAEYLSRAGVTHIITCMKQRLATPPTLDDGRTITRDEMRHVRIDDDEKAPILVHFASCNEFIAAQLEEEWVPDDDEDQAETDTASAATETDPGQEAGQDDFEASVQLLVQGRQKRGGRWGSWQTTGAGTMLVHCQAGCSRSVAIVAAYLMHTRRISAATAVAMVRARRPDAEPNTGFMAQLELYEQVGFEVDMKFQAVRRFLMSKTDILNGDSMDDMLLSYYPSPYPSPALSAASGIKGFTAITMSNSLSSEGESHSGISRRNSASTRSTWNEGGGGANLAPNAKNVSSCTTTINTNTAAPLGSSHDTDQPRRPRSRSASVCSSASSNSGAGGAGTRISLLSSINDDAARTGASVTQLEKRIAAMEASGGSQSSAAGTGAPTTLVQQSDEVKVTANSSGRLPGGVAQIRGHEGVNNRGALAKPTFAGPKLRCRACRRELAALDHVVIHEPGKGQMAFDHRRRDVGFQAQNVASTTEEESKQEESEANPEESSPQEAAGAATGTSASQPAAVAAAANPAASAGRPAIKSAASLASQLPPHLAALRGGARVGAQPSHPPRAAVPSAGSMDAMLKSPACSAYFVEPMAWMSYLGDGAVTGRLTCPAPKCAAKLGSWDWAGMQCACGAWITPAFALHRSKVDEV
jgi:dual specificity phosphatase 12